MCEKIVTPPFHLQTMVPKSLYCLQDSENANVSAHSLGGVWAPTDWFVSKKPKKMDIRLETKALEYFKKIN